MQDFQGVPVHVLVSYLVCIQRWRCCFGVTGFYTKMMTVSLIDTNSQSTPSTVQHKTCEKYGVWATEYEEVSVEESEWQGSWDLLLSHGVRHASLIPRIRQIIAMDNGGERAWRGVKGCGVDHRGAVLTGAEELPPPKCRSSQVPTSTVHRQSSNRQRDFRDLGY